jgi:steroid 5-alpha reductase family enzyme
MYLKSIKVCTFAYSIALIFSFILLEYISLSHIWLEIISAHLTATFVIFSFSLVYKNSSLYDPFWSVMPFFIFLYLVFNVQVENSSISRLILIGIPITYYAIRLTWNWSKGWEGLNDEDFRYLNLYATFGNFKWFINLFGIHLFPTLIVNVCLFPLYYAISINSEPLNFIDFFFFIFTIFAVILEHVSDEQMHKFRSNKQNISQTMNQGLWKHSRHPNYLGEILFWFGIFGFSLSQSYDNWWLIVFPISMLLMFVLSSIPMMDNRSLERREDYFEYMEKTSSLLPIKLLKKIFN